MQVPPCFYAKSISLLLFCGGSLVVSFFLEYRSFPQINIHDKIQPFVCRRCPAEFIDSYEVHIRALNEDGAKITGTEAFHKADGQWRILPKLRPYLKEDSAICTLQNGVLEPWWPGMWENTVLWVAQCYGALPHLTIQGSFDGETQNLREGVQIS